MDMPKGKKKEKKSATEDSMDIFGDGGDEPMETDGMDDEASESPTEEQKEDSSGDPALKDVSDDDLIAELKARGLDKKMEEEETAADEMHKGPKAF